MPVPDECILVGRPSIRRRQRSVLRRTIDHGVDTILPILRDCEQASVVMLQYGEVDTGPILQMLIVLDRLGVSERLTGRVDLFDVCDHLLEERSVLGV